MKIRKRGLAEAQRALETLGFEGGCTALEAAARLRVLVDDLEGQAVGEMRRLGLSWAAIGRCVGLTRQGAEQRWGN